MIFNESKHEFTLSTGTTFYAYEGILGLHSDYGLTYGWDGEVGEMFTKRFTKEEKAEIADYMIELWTKFKSRD